MVYQADGHDRLVVSYDSQQYSTYIDVGQPKSMFVKKEDTIRHIIIFIFGTEKMAFYKVSLDGRFTITHVDFPALSEERVVYSAYSDFFGSQDISTHAQYVVLAGGVKHSERSYSERAPDGQLSDAIDVYRISIDT